MARPKKALSAAEQAKRAQERVDRFHETGEKRVNAAIRAIRNIGKMGTSPNYTATEQEVELLFNALASELQKARQAYVPGTKAKAPEFSFGTAS